MGSTSWTDDLSSRFAEWWCTTFPDSQSTHLRIEECPILIGVMRCSLTEQKKSSPFDYQCHVLLREDRLMKTDQRSTLENVIETLGAFRQEWQRNEKFWVSVIDDDRKTKALS
jgi:hypothetical protein